MGSIRTLGSMCSDFSPALVAYVLPPAGALLSATALWVASRAHTTSQVAQSTSQAALKASGLVSVSPDVIAQVRRAPDPKKR